MKDENKYINKAIRRQVGGVQKQSYQDPQSWWGHPQDGIISQTHSSSLRSRGWAPCQAPQPTEPALERQPPLKWLALKTSGANIWESQRAGGNWESALERAHVAHPTPVCPYVSTLPDLPACLSTTDSIPPQLAFKLARGYSPGSPPPLVYQLKTGVIYIGCYMWISW